MSYKGKQEYRQGYIIRPLEVETLYFLSFIQFSAAPDRDIHSFTKER